MVQPRELFGQWGKWLYRPGEMVRSRRMNGVMGIWSMSGLRFVRVRISVSG